LRDREIEIEIEINQREGRREFVSRLRYFFENCANLVPVCAGLSQAQPISEAAVGYWSLVMMAGPRIVRSVSAYVVQCIGKYI
jgi:hypothetical protein